jgi:snapalysin
MSRRTFVRALVVAAAAVPLAGGMQSVVASPAIAAEIQAVTITYDDSRAAEFKPAVASAANVWNTSVRNVRLTPAQPGRRAEIVIIADNGWPRATLGPVRPGGRATVWMGRQATAQGHDAIRIAAHELGHSFGLPDRKPGPCSSLMSGSTGGVSCKNPVPNAQEKAQVERNYRTLAVQPADSSRVLVDVG